VAVHHLAGREDAWIRGAAAYWQEASVCILLYQNPLSGTARERLRIIYESTDGFEIARHDLRIRGPGELLGARQSGLPMLRFADLERDLDLLEAARDAADRLLRDWPDHAQAHLNLAGWPTRLSKSLKHLYRLAASVIIVP
jgi:ATP-dependent DNA helicase RecG